jgi:hypothetical protein
VGCQAGEGIGDRSERNCPFLAIIVLRRGRPQRLRRAGCHICERISGLGKIDLKMLFPYEGLSEAARRHIAGVRIMNSTWHYSAKTLDTNFASARTFLQRTQSIDEICGRGISFTERADIELENIDSPHAVFLSALFTVVCNPSRYRLTLLSLSFAGATFIRYCVARLKSISRDRIVGDEPTSPVNALYVQ